MEKNKIIKRIYLLVFIISNILCLDNLNIKSDINSNDFHEALSINLNQFVEGTIDNKTPKIDYNYKIDLSNLDKTENILFDYQSEFGCLTITIKDSKFSETFCSKGNNDIYILNMTKIPNIKDMENLDMTLSVGNQDSDIDSNFSFDFSLKVSIQNSLNIYEIDSDHKTGCKMEKVENEDKYRCLFLIKNKNNIKSNDELIIYTFPSLNLNELNIYADYINKSIYDEFNNDELNALIPNENSEYTNKRVNESNLPYIKISNLDNNKYIYVSIESNKEDYLEIISQIIQKNNDYNFPSNDNKIQIFAVENKEITISMVSSDLVTGNYNFAVKFSIIEGKASVNNDKNNNKKFIIDERDNNAYFLYETRGCYVNADCRLTINNIDEQAIFYLSFTKYKINEIPEIIYGQSSKFYYKYYNSIPDNIIYYEYLPYKKDSINANIQIYNYNEPKNDDIFDIEAFLLSKDTILNIKKNNNLINGNSSLVKEEFFPLTFATNLHIKKEDLIESESYLLIHIKKRSFQANDLSFTTTISEVNSLIYPSEGIYHFGEMDEENKIVYRLRGNKNFHLMRLEFGHNSPDIKWSVKRNNSENDYKTNDTLLSFVTEYFCNGRELLTMYIEKGEDIYLTIFKENNSKKKNNSLKHTYAFKYLNSAKNGDFKNYYVKDDYLNYEIEERKIKINLLKNMPNAKYYLRIIPKDNYIESENLNSISIIESNSTFLISDNSDSGIKEYSTKNVIDKYADYEVNCYIVVIDDNSDVELLSYNRLNLNKLEVDKASVGLIIAALSLAGVAFIIFILRCIHHCCCIEDYYGSKKNKKKNYYY